MARYSKDILTREDVDVFCAKLKNTVAAAEAAAGFRELAEKLNSSFGDIPAAARTSAVAAPKAKGKGRRKRQAGIDPEKVLGIVADAKNGISVGEVAAKLGEEDKQRVAAALRKLRDSKQAKLKGEKRLARWYPV